MPLFSTARLEELLRKIYNVLLQIKDALQPPVPPPPPSPGEEPDPPPSPDPGPPDTGWQVPSLWIWREGSPANDFGAKEAVVVAQNGKAGAATVRLIYRNGETITDLGSMVQRTQHARTDGCVAVCIDLESHFIRKGFSHAENVYLECSKILPLYWAPKVFLDHLQKHWGFSFERSCAWLQKYSDGNIVWSYSRDRSDDWLSLLNRYRANGYAKPFIPLGDFAERSSGGERTSPWGPEVPVNFSRHNMSCGVFMPDSNNWPDVVTKTDTWGSAVEIYS